MVRVCLPLPRSGEHQKQWDFVLSNFPADIFVVGDADVAPTTNVFKAATYVADVTSVPGPLIVLSPAHARYIPGVISLEEFVHPIDATYVYGPEHVPLSHDYLNVRPDHEIFIPTASRDDMYSWVAYAVTSWDRRMKHG